MIIQLQQDISANDQEALTVKLEQLRLPSFLVETQYQKYMVCVSDREFDIRRIGGLEGVRDIHRVSGAQKLVSRKWKVGRTNIDLGDGISIGNGGVCMMAGPCSIESEEQIKSVVDMLVKQGVRIMRGGVYKPRTSPYSFRGMGLEGLKVFHEHCRMNGIKIITEVMEAGQIGEMHDYVDIFQVGARNSQNFNLLDALGELDKAVLIKRGISGSIQELLYSAEYVFKNGNERIILCERGIRTFEKASRNTLDLNAVPILQSESHLPVVVDPSHGIGIRRHVPSMALAAVAAGADGLLIEIHPKPEEATTDGQQTLDFRQFEDLVNKVKAIAEVR